MASLSARLVSVVTIIAASACSSAEPEAEAPAASEGALVLGNCKDPAPPAQVARIEALSKASPAELERLFAEAPSPEAAPRGTAFGTHVVPPDNKAKIPKLVELGALHLWQCKEFPESGPMVDYVSASKNTKAALSVEPIESPLRRYCEGIRHTTPESDGRPSLITDYTTVTNLPPVGWIDEMREIEPGIWLGRSFYDCDLWAYVLLRIERSSDGR